MVPVGMEILLLRIAQVAEILPPTVAVAAALKAAVITIPAIFMQGMGALVAVVVALTLMAAELVLVAMVGLAAAGVLLLVQQELGPAVMAVLVAAGVPALTVAATAAAPSF